MWNEILLANFDTIFPKNILCMCVYVDIFSQGQDWENQPFAEFTSSQGLVANRWTNATLSHFWASHNVLHYKAQDKKEGVNTKLKGPIHAKTVITQKTSLSNKLFHTTTSTLVSEHETCAHLEHRGTGLPNGRVAFQAGCDFEPQGNPVNDPQPLPSQVHKGWTMNIDPASFACWTPS